MAMPGIANYDGSWLPAVGVSAPRNLSARYPYYYISSDGSWSYYSKSVSYAYQVTVDSVFESFVIIQLAPNISGTGAFTQDISYTFMELANGLCFKVIARQNQSIYNIAVSKTIDGVEQTSYVGTINSDYPTFAFFPVVITNSIGYTDRDKVIFNYITKPTTVADYQFRTILYNSLNDIVGSTVGLAISGISPFTVHQFIVSTDVLTDDLITDDISTLYSNDLAYATVKVIPTYAYYSGSAITPMVEVWVRNTLLTAGVDYTVGYFNNVDPGTGKVNVAGIGDYTGNQIAYFTILAAQALPPYEQTEPSGAAYGGQQTIPPNSTISAPTLPSMSMADTGFCRIYNPSLAQLQSLSNYLWTDDTFWETMANHFRQLIENPMDAIICLNLLPCNVPSAGSEEFRLMYISTGVQLTKASTQFVDVNCGTAQVIATYGSALDYSPYTKVSLFLPFVGMVSLNTDEVMGATLNIVYRIDIVSGACVAMVKVDDDVLYQFSGHCAINMPLTGANYSSLASAMVQATKSVALLSAGAVGTAAGTKAAEHALGSISAHLAANEVSNTVNAVIGSKPDVARTGTFTGNSGYLGVRRPFLVIERPRLCNPQEYGKFNGYPSMVAIQLSAVSGFTQVQQIQLTGLAATKTEQEELHALLKEGVIL